MFTHSMWSRAPLSKPLISLVIAILLKQYMPAFSIPNWLPIAWIALPFVFLFLNRSTKIRMPIWFAMTVVFWATLPPATANMELPLPGVFELEELDRKPIHHGKMRLRVSARPMDSTCDSTSFNAWYYLDSAEVENRRAKKWIEQVEMEQINGAILPGLFDFRSWSLNRGVVFTVKRESVSTPLVTEQKAGFTLFLENSRIQVKRFINNNLAGEEAGLVTALLTGDRGKLSSRVETSFQRSGMSHILAVSGMHVGIFIGCIVWLLGALGVRKKWKMVLGLVGMWMFILFTGAATSTIRAGLMMTGWSGGILIGRKGTGLNGYCLALLVLLLVDPNQLVQAGFQLSASAVLGILWFQPALLRRWPFDGVWMKRIGAMVTVTVSAQLGVLPTLFYHFHQFSLVFLWSNLILLPLIAPILYLGVIAISIQLFGYTCQWIWQLESFLTRQLIKGSDHMGHEEFLLANFPWNLGGSCLLIVALISLRMWMLSRRYFWKYAVVLCLNGVAWVIIEGKPDLKGEYEVSKGNDHGILHVGSAGADLIWVSGAFFDSGLTMEDVPRFLEQNGVHKWKIWLYKNGSEWPAIGYSGNLLIHEEEDSGVCRPHQGLTEE